MTANKNSNYNLDIAHARMRERNNPNENFWLFDSIILYLYTWKPSLLGNNHAIKVGLHNI